ncbi:peptidoglycan-binding domain-containing protein [Mycolicibacterium neworleansense]|uniref:Putative peptidoglycan binding domain protein n=1 Tax=Mycolicibacterium neworleansense TaxID=146018 RepID=A0A0H5RS84_9MYCO|nr:peptidoglycan-binding domain-containing protein [Mycolicibacterium neworleansense]MCV7365642.1 peptidoglycan-binding protein [Mycolicibacterium neworleansense]CRZ16342.1 Putative peptidoglycan binding domain protein [Mycolicibacterium neworleansense]
MTWRGFELTDPPMSGPDIALIRDKLVAKFNWARAMGVTEGDVYDQVTADAVTEFQRRVGLPENGIADFKTRVRLGAWPPPPPPRHAGLTFRGTGGIVGMDYTSRVAQAAGLEEIPILYPGSMGGIPVGAENNPNAPSGNDSVDIAVELAIDWIEQHPKRSFCLLGYSQGAIGASKVRAELLPGGRLEKFADNYVCGMMIANPSRAFGHTFFLGPVPDGEGISNFHLPREACTWDWCELVQPDDFYANVPLGDVGDVCRQGQNIVMDTTVSDPIGMMQKVIPHLIKILDEAGVDLPPNPLGILNGVWAGLVSSLLPGVVPAQFGSETAAAVHAARLALTFFAAQPPTRPHITYEFVDVLPGRTYLQLGIDHVRDWADRTSVRM